MYANCEIFITDPELIYYTGLVRIKNWFVACVLIYAGGKYQGRDWTSSEACSTVPLLKQLKNLLVVK